MEKLIILVLLLLPVSSYGWTLSSTFEDGTLDQIAGTTGPNGYVGGLGGFQYAGQATTYSNTHAHGGTMSAQMHWTTGSEGFGEAHGQYYIGAVGTDGIWVRGYFYFPAGFDFTASDVNKLIRITTTSGMDSIFINADTPSSPNVGKIASSNEPADYQNDVPSSGFNTGGWHCFEMHIQFGNPGVQRVWLDGVMKWNDTTHDTGTAGSAVYFMTNWNGGSPADQDMWIDDIIITTDTPMNMDASNNPMIGLSYQISEGFEGAGIPAGWYAEGSGINYDFTTEGLDGEALDIATYDSKVHGPVLTPDDTLYVTARVKSPVLPGSTVPLLRIYGSSRTVELAHLMITANGGVAVQAAGGTTVYSPGPIMEANVARYLKLVYTKGTGANGTVTSYSSTNGYTWSLAEAASSDGTSTLQPSSMAAIGVGNWGSMYFDTIKVSTTDITDARSGY